MRTLSVRPLALGQPDWPMRWFSLVGSIGLGLALAGVALFALPAARAAAAPAGTTFTYPGGGSCATTLQVCINAASAGDTIDILANTYTQSFSLNKAVSLIGAGPNTTKFVALTNQRVLTVSGSLTTSTVISGLTFTGGHAGSGLDYGGGIYLIAPAQPLLANLVISNNTATTGGGLATDLPVQMINSLVYSNAASAAGGGLRGPANLVDDQIISNTGLVGGGLWTLEPVTITRGRFERNHATDQGGALFTLDNLVMTGTQVVSNTATNTAGGMEVHGTGTALISGGYFTGNQSINGGALDVYALTFNGTVFANNTSTGPGGAINDGLWVSGQNGRFTANRALGVNGKGGAIYAGGAMTLTGMVMLSNTAEAEGGAVFSLSGGRLTGGHLENNSSPGSYGGGMSLDSYPSFPKALLDLSGTDFVSNSAAFGGGLYIYQPATITGGTFTRNTAGSTGGGIEIDDDVALSGTAFVSNHAGSGGGLYVYQGAAIITNGTFLRNLASGAGGGLYVDTYGLIASGTVFSGNTAVNSDGGGAQVDGVVSLSGGLFEANHSGGYGGGLYTNGTGGNSHSVLNQTDFISNSAVADGGGLNAYDEQAFINGGRFERNTSAGYGGGWYVGYAVNLTNTVMMSNTAAWGGGGSAPEGGTLQNVQITGNRATGGGGGLYSLGGLDVEASRLAGNSAPVGGAGYLYANATFVNSLLADNQASVTAAGLYLTFFGNVSVIHSTIAAASLSPRQAIVLSSGTLQVTDTIVSNYAVGISVTTGTAAQNFNLFYGNTANTAGSVTGANSLIGQNPLFANPAGGDYHLTDGSPAINHGTNAGVNVDYDGDPRPAGGGFDIGFDEHTAAVLNHKLYLPLVLR